MQYATLQITGEKAGDFLQGQLTCDIHAAESTASAPMKIPPLFGAYCDRKGRVISSVWVEKKGETTWQLTVRASMEKAVKTRLLQYGRFSRVEITASTEETQEWKASHPYLSTLHCAADYLHAGLVEIEHPISERFTPHMLAYPEHGAVSFEKGCYIGQEIIARAQHRGSNKRQLYIAYTTTPLSTNMQLADCSPLLGTCVVGQAARQIAAASTQPVQLGHIAAVAPHAHEKKHTVLLLVLHRTTAAPYLSTPGCIFIYPEPATPIPLDQCKPCDITHPVQGLHPSVT